MISSIGAALLVFCLIAGVMALHHSSRLRERGERLRRFPKLRLTNIGLSSLGLLLLIMSLVIPAIYKVRESARRAEQRRAAGDTAEGHLQTIRSANGLFAIDIPAHWVEAPDFEAGTNGVARADIDNDLWVAMWSEPKEDLTISGLDAYAQVILDLLAVELGQTEVLERTSSTLHGTPAVEVVCGVVVDNARLVFVLRFVETPDHFVQVRAWSTRSGFRKHEATLRQIVRSVRSN